MKSNSTFMPNKPAYPATRPNEAWAVDFAVLDLAGRPRVMLVLDVATRRPLSATVSFRTSEDIIGALHRLTRRAGLPQELWIDHALEFNSALRAWAHTRDVRIIYAPIQTPRIKVLCEPILSSLGASLRDKRFPTLMELGHDIERWRQAYAPATPKLPNVNQ